MAVTRICASTTGASFSSTTLPWMRPVCASAGTASASNAPAINEVSVRRPKFPENISILHTVARRLEKLRIVYTKGRAPLCAGEKAFDIRDLSRNPGRGQRGQKSSSVPHRLQPRIEHGQHAPIVAMPDEATQTLQQREDRQRHLILAEWLAPAVGD